MLACRCDFCGAKIEREAWRIRGQTLHFCNLSCSTKWHWKNDPPRKGSQKRIVRCEYCGKEIERYVSQLNKSDHACCSLACNAMIADHSEARGPQNPTLDDTEWLKRQYIDLERSAKSIGDELGIGCGTVCKWLKKSGVPVRSVLPPVYEKLTDKAWLSDQYINQYKSTNEIAEMVGCNGSTVYEKLVGFGISTRRRGGSEGENNWNWKGGIARNRKYCPKFNKTIKAEIREEFEYKCYLCGKPETGKAHDVHHCDYRKSQGCKGHRWSLIPLCKSCHTKTNHNRWYWFALLRDYWIYKYISFSSMKLEGD